MFVLTQLPVNNIHRWFATDSTSCRATAVDHGILMDFMMEVKEIISISLIVSADSELHYTQYTYKNTCKCSSSALQYSATLIYRTTFFHSSRLEILDELPCNSDGTITSRAVAYDYCKALVFTYVPKIQWKF